MKLDRDLQRKILEIAATTYPHDCTQQLRPINDEVDEALFEATVFYLADHDLLDIKHSQLMSGVIHINKVTITARGLDFLADDGGLSAILGVVTVKLHGDTIKDLIDARIDADPKLSGPEKSKMREAIRNLPAKAIEKISGKALEYGMTHGPDALHWITQHLPPL